MRYLQQKASDPRFTHGNTKFQLSFQGDLLMQVLDDDGSFIPSQKCIAPIILSPLIFVMPSLCRNAVAGRDHSEQTLQRFNLI